MSRPPRTPTTSAATTRHKATRAASSQNRRSARTLYARLKKLYPQAGCELEHRDAYQLLVATILSAQCTDVRVNMVTPGLFNRYPNPRSLARAEPAELEQLIRSTGFFRNKAKNLKGAAELIDQVHASEVPDTMEQLTNLPGVARKTANVVLGNAFGKNEGIVVDTHVARLSTRLGLSRQQQPDKIELDLIGLFDRRTWTMLAHLLIWHGRAVCRARKPDCPGCALTQICPKIGVA